MTSNDSAQLLLGPLLRYVGPSDATIWVELDRPATVTLTMFAADPESRDPARAVVTTVPTWTVHEHHYAMLIARDLTPATTYHYEIALDDATVWPDRSDAALTALPPSTVRTHDDGRSSRVVFGSCRRSEPMDPEHLAAVGADALAALTTEMATDPGRPWADLLFLAGDQIYADDPSEALRARLRAERADGPDRDAEVREEISNFEEYTWLYQEAWSPTPVRWLLSTVPTAMLLDDHDLRDDWHTSAAWREEMQRQPWWRDRVVGAFASYWVYQHLGNLSPDQLDDDDLFNRIRQCDDTLERERMLDEFAWQSDQQPDIARWSFTRDLGRARLLAIDSRCSRRLDPDDRAMLDHAEWAWVRENALTPARRREVDHLLLGTTLPFLLMPGIHHLEGWNEAISGGAWGRRLRRLGERIRRALDLEHWSAFRSSFARMLELITEVADTAQPPASVLLLSGDVHSSYVTRAHMPGIDPDRTAVHQLVMSPFRNPLERPIQRGHALLAKRIPRALTHFLARTAKVRDEPVDWDIDQGPWFDNGIMSVEIDGRTARVVVEHARVSGGAQVLRRTVAVDLTPSDPQAQEPACVGAVGATVTP